MRAAFYDEFTFEIAAGGNADFNNLIGLDIIENFNPQLNFDNFEITGSLRPLCALRNEFDFSKTVKFLP